MHARNTAAHHYRSGDQDGLRAHLKRNNRSLRKAIFIFALLCCIAADAQDSTASKTKRIGVFGAADMVYNFGDKVLNPGLGRRFTLAISFTNKKRGFLVFFGGGIKAVKLNLYSSTFRDGFIQDVHQNYAPIKDAGEARLIGQKVSQSPGNDLWGTYSQFLSAGFILNKKFRPSVTVCAGQEDFLLFDDGFAYYEDPGHGDIRYVTMPTTFYELKAGLTFPSKKLMTLPGTLNLGVGYRLVDYGHLAFNGTRLSAYTQGDLESRYRWGGKLVVSLTFMIWSNWK